MPLKHYLQEMFEPSLLYGFSLALLGLAASWHYGHFSLLLSLLVVVGTVLAQMSVNVISDYFDYTSGLDKELVKGKSGDLGGGSSFIANGLITARSTLALGVIIFAFAAAIGIYLLYVRIAILPILAVAALSIFLYARYIKRVPYLSEIACTVNYTMICLGAFVVVSGVSGLSYSLIFSFIPAGIMLGGNALYVNSVPDSKTDRKYDVRHSAIMLGSSKNIGNYYLATQSIAFLVLLLGIITGALPLLAVICFATVPVTFCVFKGLYTANSRNYGRYLELHTLASVAFALMLCLSYVLAL